MTTISRKNNKPMTSDEINTVKALLEVSDKRISQKQKECIIHLIAQYEILNLDRLNKELSEMNSYVERLFGEDV